MKINTKELLKFKKMVQEKVKKSPDHIDFQTFAEMYQIFSKLVRAYNILEFAFMNQNGVKKKDGVYLQYSDDDKKMEIELIEESEDH